MHSSTVFTFAALVATTVAAPLELDSRQGLTYGPSWCITNYDGRSTSPAGAIIHFNISYTAPESYDEPTFTAYCEYNTAEGGEQPCPVTAGGRTWGVFASDNPDVSGKVGIDLRHSFQTNPNHFFNVTGGFVFDFGTTPQPAPPFEVTDLKISEHYCAEQAPC